ncbi:PD-(D/E)XK motif protein [Bradyrhizobium sp. LA7.1]|uniref:PD-(D/E)XK motif protein n=1 Tax=Bradyrhizobium sp. LA7.1 TaxID=3156324 RepID=UPI003396073B
MSDQWSEIPSSDHPGVDNVRRVEVQYPLDFRRGKDFHGRYIFMLEGMADKASLPLAPKLGGIDVSADFDGTGSCKLVLTLLDPAYVEIFRVLCHDLLSATSRLPRGDNSKGLIIVLDRLVNWQHLLRRRQDQILTKQQIIGLMGELLFLRDIVLKAVGSEGVSAWRGSFGDEQDFVHGEWIFEIKTQLSTADQRMQISSEAQLDTSSGKILICHQTLGASSADDPRSRSLNELVQEIRSALGSDSTSAAMDFELSLAKANYTKRPDYDDNRWVLSTRKTYEVLDKFPRITPAMLSNGIERVAYHIRLEACKPFEIDIDKAVERVFG